MNGNKGGKISSQDGLLLSDEKTYYNLILAHHAEGDTKHLINLKLGNRKIPVCARCSGHILGVLIFYPVLFLLGFAFNTYINIIIWIIGISIIIHWLYVSVLHSLSNGRIRFIVGIIGGIVISWIIYYDRIIMAFFAITLVVAIKLIYSLGHMVERRR